MFCTRGQSGIEKRNWVCTLALIAGGLSAAPADGQCTYTSTQIEYPIDCGIGPVSTRVTGLNDGGWVCGYYWCVLSQYNRGFYRTPQGEYLEIGLPANAVGANPTDINNNGQICGWLDTESNGGFRAFVYQISTGEWTIIEPANPDLGWSFANAINDAGVVVGQRSFTFNPQPQPLGAFVWTPGGGAMDLGVMEGPHSSASDVSDSDEVVGWTSGPNSANAHPFVYQGGSVVLIPTPEEAINASARRFSDTGTEVLQNVWFENADGTGNFSQPFVWIRDSNQFVSLPPLAGSDHAAGFDLLNRYAAVGLSDLGSNDWRATIWLNGMPFELLDLVPNCMCSEFDRAFAINDLGQVLIDGATATSSVAGFLLEPINSKYADITSDCEVNVADLLIVLQNWGDGAVAADINDDGVVNVIDLLLLLGNWGS